ncbi:MAG: hypothetical protein U0470_06495 [Anaerolineae bacterium]
MWADSAPVAVTASVAESGAVAVVAAVAVIALGAAGVGVAVRAGRTPRPAGARRRR